MPTTPAVPIVKPPYRNSTEHHRKAYDLPSTKALIEYLHLTIGSPVKSTLQTAVARGNFRSFPGLTPTNIARYCPDKATPTIMGHMTQAQQGLRSTHPPPPPTTPHQVAPSTYHPPTNSITSLSHSELCTQTTVASSPSALKVAINTSWSLTMWVLTPYLSNHLKRNTTVSESLRTTPSCNDSSGWAFWLTTRS